MESFDVNLEKRIETGKGAIRRLKNEGLVPGVLYNEGRSTPVTLEEHELTNIINRQGEDVLLKFNFNGMPVTAKIKELQRDPVSQQLRHIDLMPLADNILN